MLDALGAGCKGSMVLQVSRAGTWGLLPLLEEPSCAHAVGQCVCVQEAVQHCRLIGFGASTPGEVCKRAGQQVW